MFLSVEDLMFGQATSVFATEVWKTRFVVVNGCELTSYLTTYLTNYLTN